MIIIITVTKMVCLEGPSPPAGACCQKRTVSPVRAYVSTQAVVVVAVATVVLAASTDLI